MASGSPELRRRAVVLGVPGARDLGVRGAEWKDEDEAKLVRALEKGKPDSSPSCHGGGEVAADRGVGVAWQGREKSNARGSGRRGARARRVEGHGEQEVACGPPERRRRRSAPAAEESREGERREKRAGLDCNF